MSKVIGRASIALLLFASCLYTTQGILAQVAPTNSATISGSVSDSAGKPIVNAKVLLSGPKSTSTKTDAQGLFVFIGVPFGTYEISAAAAGLGTATRSVSVQGDTDVAIQYEPALANGLKVIANVSSSANANFNVTPASVTQVNPIASVFQGQTSWRTILEQIPGVAQAGLLCGGSAYATFPDGPFMPVQISINGALPYETATLLDDMPLMATSLNGISAGNQSTDLSVYPLNGFGAADVVRGPGASAPSIVDSIGGSFLLHPAGIVSQNHYDFSVGTDPYGGIVANALAAVRWHKLSAVVTYGVNDSPGPVNQAVIPGYTVFEPSTVNGAIFSCTGTCARSFAFGAVPGYGHYGAQYGYSNGLLTCCYQQSSAWSQHSGSIALNYQVSPAVSAEVFYAGQISQESSPFANETVLFTPPPGYAGALQAGQYELGTAGYTLEDSPLRQVSSLLEEKITARIGNGLLQLAALQNRIFSTASYNNLTSGTLQLFGGGIVGGMTTVFNGGTYDVTFPEYNIDESLWSNNRDLLLEYTIPLSESLHAGVSYVPSYYDIPLYESIIYYGIPCAPASQPSDISQSTNELRFFIGGNPSIKTSLDLSGYFVHANYHVPNPIGLSYLTDTSSNGWLNPSYTYAAPRLGFVWRPTAAVAIRAAAGGGFAEAPLYDLVGSSGAAPTLSPSGGYYTISLTNVNLQPERSFGFDLGTDIKLRRNTILSFDVYRTNLYGQLYNSSSLTGTYLGLPLYATEYGNLGESRYEGVLLDLRHDTPHGMYWALSGGLTRGYVVSVPASFYNTAGATCNTSTNTNCQNQSVVPGINFNGTFADVSVPYAQALGTFGYRWTAEKFVDLVGTYYGNNNTYFRPAFVELDGHVGYPLTKNASLLITFRNVTGIYDSSIVYTTADSFIGVPAVAGPPWPEYGEEYGPRSVILTTNVRF